MEVKHERRGLGRGLSALMADVPALTPTATPVVLLTVATVVVADAQTDKAVTFLDVPSE